MGHPARKKTREEIEAQGSMSRMDVCQYFGLETRTFDRLRSRGDFPPPRVFIGDHPHWPWSVIWAGLEAIHQSKQRTRKENMPELAE
jgi:predicted DNA-binding transcriptional regulator AlpA